MKNKYASCSLSFLVLICLLIFFPLGAGAQTAGGSPGLMTLPCASGSAGEVCLANARHIGNVDLWNQQALNNRGLNFTNTGSSQMPTDATGVYSVSSSDATIAAVSTAGVVKGVAAGSATITATTADGGFKATSTVTVKAQTATFTLTIAANGAGSTDPAAGAHAYAVGTVVKVTATPEGSATFTGWSGAASGTDNPVTLTMDADKTLTANFTDDGGGSGGDTGQPGSCATPTEGVCTTPKVRISNVDVGVTVVNNDSETQLKPLMIAAIPSGGSWLASDGSNFAAYFCEALSVSQNGCINIHEGDRMQVVDASGKLLSGHDSTDWGCSHSWNTRMVWDGSTDHFSMVCATERGGGIAQPNDPGHLLYTARDLASLSVGDIVPAGGGGDWITASDQGSVLLMHFSNGTVDKTLTLGSSPHSKLAAYGSGLMVAGWGTGATITAQVFDAASGNDVSSAFAIDVPNNIYQPFKGYPDGSVAYAAPGTGSISIRIARILPCSR